MLIWCMFVRASLYKRREEEASLIPDVQPAVLHLTADQSNFPHPGRIASSSAPNSRPPATKALHTICGNNTSIVSSSWRWAYKCPKHVEQIISAVKHSVTSSWFSSLLFYTFHHVYKTQSVNDLYSKGRCLFWDTHKTVNPKRTPCRVFWMLNLVVREVTATL